MNQLDNLNDLELKFRNLNDSIDFCKSKLNKNYNEIQEHLNQSCLQASNSLEASLNRNRNELLTKLTNHLVSLIESINSASSKQLEVEFINDIKNSFLTFTQNKTQLDKIDFGRIASKNGFEIVKKIKYLHIFNEYQEIEIERMPFNFVNIKILPFSRLKFLFYYEIMSSTGVLEIRNLIGNKLFVSKTLKRKYRLNKVMAYGRHIVGLANNLNYGSELSVYDDELNLVSTKYFTHSINLYSINQNEIVCWSSKSKNCMVLDYKLEFLFKFGQDVTRMPVQISNKHIMIYDQNFKEFNLFGESNLFCISDDFSSSKCVVKLISRESGDLVDTIKLDNTKEALVKLLNDSNMLLIQNDSTIKYLDPEGNLIVQNKCNYLENFKNFTVTFNSDIIFVDISRRKICMI